MISSNLNFSNSQISISSVLYFIHQRIQSIVSPLSISSTPWTYPSSLNLSAICAANVPSILCVFSQQIIVVLIEINYSWLFLFFSLFFYNFFPSQINKNWDWTGDTPGDIRTTSLQSRAVCKTHPHPIRIAEHNFRCKFRSENILLINFDRTEAFEAHRGWNRSRWKFIIENLGYNKREKPKWGWHVNGF